MNYQRIPYKTIQELYDRIALLEWIKDSGQMTKYDWIELSELKHMSKSYAEKRAKTHLKVVVDVA